MNTPEQFNSAWFASQPVDVQLLIANTPVGAARTSALEALAAKYAAQTPPRGLDPQILVYGRPPYWVMKLRNWEDYPPGGWVPAIGQPFLQAAPGDAIQGETAYDPIKPPAGSIKVVDPDNCDLSVEYPPAIPPTPPPLPLPADAPFVDMSRPWPDQGPNAFFSTWAGFGVPAGQTRMEGGKEWVKIQVVAFVGPAWQGWKQA